MFNSAAFRRSRSGKILLISDFGAVAAKRPAALRTSIAPDYTEAVKLARNHGRISYVTIIPGYDDTKIRKPGFKAERQDGQSYRVLWEEAVKANPDWVLITSWNEWHEGSEIEPSFEEGDNYMQLTGDYAPRFCDSSPARARRVPAQPSISIRG